MSGNSFGKLFKISTFGESHGDRIGVIIDGCPSNIPISITAIQDALNRRKPGQSTITTQRKESDTIEVHSGILDNISLGTPIALSIKNKDANSKDYDHLADVYRPGHADYTYQQKYGVRDVRGGGRSSARETAMRVAAGSIAQQVLASTTDIKVFAYVSSIKDINCALNPSEVDHSKIDSTIVRCPDTSTANKMIKAIELAKEEGDSLGGIITCVVKNCPVGLGAPVFDRLEADLAKAMLSIPATKGFEIGSGFAGTKLKGSQHNDSFTSSNKMIQTKTNNAGGVLGGISNGMDIVFRVAFKPTSTIAKKQTTINKAGETTELSAKGRHDPCVLPRAVPIVEAMTNLVLIDHYLLNKVYQ